MSNIDHKDEKDEFWDLGKLVPKRKSTLSPFATTPVVRDFHAPVPEEKRGAAEKRYDTEKRDAAEKRYDTEKRDAIKKRDAEARASSERKLSFEGMRGVSETEDKTYYPKNSLILSVTIKKPIEKDDFYDSFRKAAILYYDCPGTKSPFVQFYSYMPQYSQLTKPQKDYYFYWRSELRRGNYIKTDYSYLYLYVYEIINLPDIIEPKIGIDLLCKLWKAYRADLPRIDLYFSMWVRDYCLVHELECPFSELQDFIFDIIRVSDFKEYYFGDLGNTTRSGVWTMLAYLSDYDWHRGFYSVVGKDADNSEQKEKAEIYKSLLEGAMRRILPSVWDLCLKETDSGDFAVMSKSAFQNTLCTHSVKCRLLIEYYPLADSSAIREGITAAVRYTENKLRALFGVKSRIMVKDIPAAYRDLIDRYFAELISKTERSVKQRNMPEYEKLYDAPREKLSFEGAEEIERQSWDITLRLCDTEDYIEYASPVAADPSYTEHESTEPPFAPDETAELNTAQISESDETPEASGAPDTYDGADSYGLSADEIAYIASLCSGAPLYSGDIPEESMVERINEAFSDGFGDIIIEPTGSGYEIIEDYKEDVTEWLKKF